MRWWGWARPKGRSETDWSVIAGLRADGAGVAQGKQKMGIGHAQRRQALEVS